MKRWTIRDIARFFVYCSFFFTAATSATISTDSRVTPLKVFGILTALFWIGNLLATGRIRNIKGPFLRYLLFASWLTISVLWCFSVDDYSQYLPRLGQGLILSYIAWDLSTTDKDAQGAMQAYLLGVYASLGWIFYRYLHHVQTYAGRYSNGSTDPNSQMVFTTFLIPIGFAFALHKKDSPPWIRILNYGTPLAILFMELLSASRGGLLATGLGMIYPAMWALKKPKVVIGSLFVSALLAVMIIPRLDLTYQEKQLSTTYYQLTHGADGRYRMYKEAWSIYTKSPILGVGFANYPYVSTFRASERSGDPGTGIPVHDEYLNVLTEDGPVGLFLFLAMIYGLMKSFIKQKDLIARGYAWGFAVLLFEFIGSPAEFRNEFWIVIGLFTVVAGSTYAKSLASERGSDGSNTEDVDPEGLKTVAA